MRYRILGSTGLKVSVVGVGAWQYGGEWGKDYTPADVDAIVKQARDGGINLIDTAECYGDHLSESLVGQAIQGEREKWIVATKFGHTFHKFLDRTEHWTAKEVREQLEASLKALRTDYVDVYQFHSGADAVFFQDDLWEMLNQQVAAGKIRFLGVSIGRVKESPQIDAAGRYNIRVAQIYYNRLSHEPEGAVFDSCRRQNLGVFSRVPLESGFLSGKYKPGAAFDSNDVRSRRKAEALAKTLTQVEEIRQNEVPAGVPMAQWALAWCLTNPAVTSVIPGCQKPRTDERQRRRGGLGDAEDRPPARRIEWRRFS